MSKLKLKLTIALVIIVILSIPAYFIGRTFGVFQGEVVLSKYALAIEKDGKRYNAWPLLNYNSAMDKKGEERQFYYRVDTGDLDELFMLAYGQYEVNSSEENPFLDGKIQYDNERVHAYIKTVPKFENANDYTNMYEFFDDKGNHVYTYDPSAPMDTDYVKDIIHAGMSRTSAGGGTTEAVDRYINVTKLFKDKLDITVRLKVDDDNRIVTIVMTRDRT